MTVSQSLLEAVCLLLLGLCDSGEVTLSFGAVVPHSEEGREGGRE